MLAKGLSGQNWSVGTVPGLIEMLESRVIIFGL